MTAQALANLIDAFGPVEVMAWEPDDIGSHAIAYAAAGYAIFPLAGKVPMTDHGKDDATTDIAEVARWWRRWPHANIGGVIPDGVLVVDVDPLHGGDDTLAGLEERNGPLPETLTTITGSGGRHLWFTTSARGLRQRKLGVGVDTRIAGKGYVVLAPSVHPDTGRQYEWVDEDAPVATAPPWVLHPLRDYPRPPAPVWHKTSSEGGDIIARCVDKIRAAPEGSRHETLLRMGTLLGGYVAVGVLSEDDARAALLAATSTWPHPRKTGNTIDDALAYGQTKPVAS